MTTDALLEVPLSSIPLAFEGVVPAAIATVDAEGMPNVTFLSVVHRIDDAHVALSRQFFNKTDSNTVVNPRAQVNLIEPASGGTYLLDLVYERTERNGPFFERMRTRLDAVAAAEGMTNIFVLSGVDICRVEACRPNPPLEIDAGRKHNVQLERVMAYSTKLADAGDMEEVLDTAMAACAELLGNPHVFIMLLDESGESLYTVASTGYADSGMGSEVRLGVGLVGLAAERRQSVRVTNMGRELSYSRATRVDDRIGVDEDDIPLPSLPAIQSQLATPMLAAHSLVGMICLQSEQSGRFQSDDECIVAILANQVAMALTSMPVEVADGEEPAGEAPPVQVKYYLEDDSVFLDNEYLIKGVAGAILWRLLQVYQAEGRRDFSNKEVRLDPSLQLPDIKDNLEARLILLRRRLEERCDYLRIEKTARGRFHLQVTRPLVLSQVG
ncbi:MAG: GAF domain-containing protein [Dehalococcoidia bacterium]